MASITTLFLDVGGVLGTNGWDRQARERAAKQFNLDRAEVDERHHLTFDTYEEGKLSLDEYLSRTIFYEQRTFSRDEFKAFMLAQSVPYPQVIELVRKLKSRYRLKVAVVSNEGRELMTHRIPAFGLVDFVDFFVVSSFVHFRKPDADIYRIALDIAQVPPSQVAYLEDRPMFVDVAQGLGIHAIQHVNYESTRAALSGIGLSLS